MHVLAPSRLRQPWPAYRSYAETTALHGIFFLTGLGTVALGSILPAIILRWHLDDRRGGLLLGVQFLGSFLGPMTLGRNLRKNLSLGCAAIVLGFAWVAVAVGMPGGFAPGVCGFAIAGFGLGRSITTINLIAGARFGRRRASALSLLNLTWGLGALAGPVAAERTAERLSIAGMFASLSAVNAIAMVCGLLLLRECFIGESAKPIAILPRRKEPAGGRRIVSFAAAFCLYGGIEASLSGWTSSLTTRSAGGTLHLGADVTTSLWMGIAAGRGVAALLLLRAGERTLMAGALVFTGMLTIVLLQPGSGGVPLVLVAFGIGVALAPVFPSLCSLLLAKALPAGRAGRVIAATALGAAIFPWLVGILSEKSGALQHGLLIPVALCALLAMLLPSLSAQGKVAESRN